MQRWRLGFFLPIVVLLSGCGVGAYQEQMDKTRQRMAYLDEEHELLEDPAFFPAKAPPIFFRPPRGIALHASEKSFPPSDWMFHFPWADVQALVPPVEVFVGEAKKAKDERADAWLNGRVLEYLRLHADEKPGPRAGDSPSELVLTRFSDSPTDRKPIRYRRYGFHTDQESPQWPSPSRPRLPERCQYNYDVYLTETPETWAVVVFKELNTTATAESWLKRGVSADQVKKLPAWNPKPLTLNAEFGQPLAAREASLATLVVGERAERRLKLMGR
jgi:hypothetical protein